MALSAVAAAAAAAMLAGAKQEGKLVWYNVPTPFNAAVVAEFKKAHPEIDVQVLSTGGTQVVARFTSERETGATSADCVSSGLAEAFPELRAKGLLAPLASLPHWKDAPAWTRDPHGAYFYYAAFDVGVLYNTKALAGGPPPSSFAQLADPEWKGRVALMDLSAGFTVPAFRFLVGRLGWDWVGRLRANEPQFAANAGQLIDAIGSGRRAVAIARDSEYQGLLKQGAPVGFKTAEEGLLLHLMPVAINSAAAHPNAAKLFVDWLLSPEARRALGQRAEKRGWAPDAETVTREDSRAFADKLTAALHGP